MKYLILLLVLLLSTDFVNAQYHVTSNNDYYLIIRDDENRTLKEIHVSDEVRIKQFNSKLTKGHVTSIREFDLMIDSNWISLEDIEKISTKKSWSQGVGGFLLAAGIGLAIADLSSSSKESIPDTRGAMSILGLILIIPGAAMVPPNYHQLGKSKWLVVVPSKQTVLK